MQGLSLHSEKQKNQSIEFLIGFTAISPPNVSTVTFTNYCADPFLYYKLIATEKLIVQNFGDELMKK